MAIVKNDPIYPFKDSDYSNPRHIIVEGSYEEIGFDLGTLAKSEYGCKLCVYDDPVYAEARREYMAANWRQMLERSKGVQSAYGLPENDVVFDATVLPFDWYDEARGADLGANTCSGAVLPIEKTKEGATFVSRNFDLTAMPLWSGLLGKIPPEGAKNAWSRGVVLETRPKGGFRSIHVGGQEMLAPWLDAINEKGLYITAMHDPWGVGDEIGSPGGQNVSGVTLTQLFALLIDTCATVEEAKKVILKNRIMQTIMRGHMMIADKSGDATVFEIDRHSQAYVFVDREANEPLFVTNHPNSRYPGPSTYPDFDMTHEHNTFTRQCILRDTYAALTPPFTKEDVTALTDSIHCAFVDDELAEAGPKERTLVNTTADLSKPEISVRWYLGDIGPVAGTNQVKTRMSEFFSFGF
ncbi:carcinine hydrolase/isopenicillin-N N-acyltransferase family protein [Ruegeria atlantica]|uniref:carcinine hydrolase/isopenicillin-N N-acyltransferase family protein n=1 Tax=Ruegeria atlantica TaxID=81569 RepID=UPI00147D8E4F|nr:carcinine hydrolase/isopenicillin-N N-acyltransferase family protein [Ruegeria atlantica]